MIDELACGPVHYDQVTPATPCDWVLESGWYDCQLGSAFLVALARARGIPARIVGGYVRELRLAEQAHRPCRRDHQPQHHSTKSCFQNLYRTPNTFAL
jgi:hypothetical protein